LESGNTKWTDQWGYEIEEKSDDIFSRLNTIHEYDRRRGGHRPTAGTAFTR